GALIMIAGDARAITRNELLDSALGAWSLGQANPSLTQEGGVTTGFTPTGIGAMRAHSVAKMQAGYFNAGTAFSVTGSGLTVHLRAYDPTGSWNTALFAKRGSHASLNYNLFATDLASTGSGSDIGFEVRTSTGFHQISFPVTAINSTAWVDLVGRYDGAKLQLFCNGRLMAERISSGDLQSNGEPLLIGAETDNGSVVRLFTGQLDEAALFDRAVSDEEVALLSRTPQVWLEPSTLIHYRNPNHDVGDLRPQFVNGEFIVSYLYNPGIWNCHILRSKDLLHWEDYTPTHSPAQANQEVPNYFVLSFLRDPLENKWKSFYGYNGMRASVSDDLVSWTAATPQLLMGTQPTLYDRESDPYVFWNADRNQYWAVRTLGKVGLPANQRGAIGYATSSDLKAWINRGELYFPGNVGDPECPSMFKMGNTWFLLASYYDQAVGAPTYRTSSTPEGPWSAQTPDRLDGKDFCAGFSVDTGSRRVMLGWIPRNVSSPGNQNWGGHIAFPREIVAFSDGTIGTVLTSEYRQKLPGQQSPNGFRAYTGAWTITASDINFSTAFQSGIAALEGTIERPMLTTDLSFSSTSRSARVHFDWSESGPSYAVLIDRANRRLAIETPGGITYADLPLREITPKSYPLSIYTEEDIIEVFFADRYSLCARIPKKLGATSIALEVDSGLTRFQNLKVGSMKGLNEIPTGNVDGTSWQLF
ncbi:MAG TPA: hypothetical protein PKH51_01950, partial [Candidatus Sumerlaeota bacterium]|nr:hypothetical protein [Candidatus Sumerlaeota bacterium]